MQSVELVSLPRLSFLTLHAYWTLAPGFRAVKGEINALFNSAVKVVHEDWDLQLRRWNPHVSRKLQPMSNAPGVRMTRGRLRESRDAGG